jgi:hypothetical protein
MLLGEVLCWVSLSVREGKGIGRCDVLGKFMGEGKHNKHSHCDLVWIANSRHNADPQLVL